MYAIKQKPLSVNRCWQGRRFKTPEYKAYEEEVMYKLPPLSIDPRLDYRLLIEVGVSSALADLDNVVKPFLDILQKKYGFNDRDVWEIHMKKVKVQKGDEYIKFNLEDLDAEVNS